MMNCKKFLIIHDLRCVLHGSLVLSHLGMKLAPNYKSHREVR